MWYVYIIERKDGSLYTGMTSNIDRRLKEHDQKHSPIVINFQTKLLYKESLPDQLQAVKREKQIKGWTRRKKLALIEGNLDLLKKLWRRNS